LPYFPLLPACEGRFGKSSALVNLLPGSALLTDLFAVSKAVALSFLSFEARSKLKAMASPAL